MHPRRKPSAPLLLPPSTPPPRATATSPPPRGSYRLLCCAALFLFCLGGIARVMQDRDRGGVADLMNAVSRVPVPLTLEKDEDDNIDELSLDPDTSQPPPPPPSAEMLSLERQARRTVCVFCANPRTASFVKTDVMRRFGGGVFDYVVETQQRGCKQNYPDAPVVGMFYQKALQSYSDKALDQLVGQLDAFIIMGDEMCNTPEATNAKAHARQYYSQVYVDYLTHHPSETAFATAYLPLGPRFEFQPVGKEDIRPPSQRTLLFNLIVSPTSPGRKRLGEQLSANLAKGVYQPGRVFVHVTPAFRTNVSASEGFVPPDQYRATLLNSVFTLCPAGKNPEAYRIFEAVESGSIPVLALDEEYMKHPCKDSFAPFRESGAPFLFISSWQVLDQELERAMPTLETRQKDLLAWYERFWTDVSSSLECLISERFRARGKGGEDTLLEPQCREQAGVLARTKGVRVAPASLPPSTSTGTTTKSPPTPSGGSGGAGSGSTPLITGCGRTGTLSLADFLNENGVPAVHERMERGAISVSWLYAFPDADVYPFESTRDIKYRRSQRSRLAKTQVPLFSPILHVVRHPLKVISSTRRCFCGRGTRSTNRGERSDKKSWLFVEKQLGPAVMNPTLPLDSVKRSMVYWFQWNSKILATTRAQNGGKDVFFRIEDLNPRALLQAMGFGPDVADAFPERIPRDENSLRHVSPQTEKEKLPDVTWKDLFDTDPGLAEKIFNLAKVFGYEADKDVAAVRGG